MEITPHVHSSQGCHGREKTGAQLAGRSRVCARDQPAARAILPLILARFAPRRSLRSQTHRRLLKWQRSMAGTLELWSLCDFVSFQFAHELLISCTRLQFCRSFQFNLFTTPIKILTQTTQNFCKISTGNKWRRSRRQRVCECHLSGINLMKWLLFAVTQSKA